MAKFERVFRPPSGRVLVAVVKHDTGVRVVQWDPATDVVQTLRRYSVVGSLPDDTVIAVSCASLGECVDQATEAARMLVSGGA